MPGPLKTLPRRRRTASWQVSFGLFAALAAVTGLAVAYASSFAGGDAGSASSAGTTVAAYEPPEASSIASPRIEPPAPAANAAADPAIPSPVARPRQVTAERTSVLPTTPVRHDDAAGQASAAAPVSPKPIAAKPAFQLETLPVLEADEASFGLDYAASDVVPTPPVRAAAKPASRKATSQARGDAVASALRPAQPKPSAGQ